MRLPRPLAALAAGLTLAACSSLLPDGEQTLEPSELEGGAYRLDPDHATLLFKVSHLGFSKYVGRFNDFDAMLDFDPAAPQESRLSVVVRVASLDVGDPDFAAELAGPVWFDAARFPEATFESTSIDVSGEATGQVRGDFTLHGVTRPLTLEVQFNGGAYSILTNRYTLGFEAHGSFARSEHGIDRLLPAIGDEVELEIHAEFMRVE